LPYGMIAVTLMNRCRNRTEATAPTTMITRFPLER
jgi:hypothetical protein